MLMKDWWDVLLGEVRLDDNVAILKRLQATPVTVPLPLDDRMMSHIPLGVMMGQATSPSAFLLPLLLPPPGCCLLMCLHPTISLVLGDALRHLLDFRAQCFFCIFDVGRQRIRGSVLAFIDKLLGDLYTTSKIEPPQPFLRQSNELGTKHYPPDGKRSLIVQQQHFNSAEPAH